VIHSLVVCRDHSVLAQLGTADMRVPIAYGLAWPERIESGASRLDFETLGGLTFEPADPIRFPAIALAYQALRGPDGSSAVLNAANEVAVAAFLAGTIRFDRIHSVNAGTVDALVPEPEAAASLDGLLDLDARARSRAAQLVKELSA
jgi:1-deoxy-D-xylulose-5-phosphate reductoisomerase